MVTMDFRPGWHAWSGDQACVYAGRALDESMGHDV